MLTRIAHGRVQQVHGGPSQAEPIHAVWGLFEVRHHANSRVEAPRRIQGARRGAVRSPTTAQSFSLFYFWGLSYGDRRHMETI